MTYIGKISKKIRNFDPINVFAMKSLKSFALLILLSLSLTAFSSGAVDNKATFTAASYNLRQANHSDSVDGNGWGRRLPVLAELIRFHGFDIFGTQEGFKHQLDGLSELLPGYAYTGIGREDGKDAGEHSAIFYRTDMFELLDHGDFWLSETPERPGLGWDAVCPRICSWGKFLHYPSGQVFVFFNLHMDHVGKQARIESANLVKQRIAQIAPGEPAIVTGDFNVDQTHQSYRTMKGNNELCDSYEVAEMRYAPNGTFNSYHTDDYTTSRIDHVFVTPDIEVLKYGVLTDTYRTADGKTEVSKLSNAPGEIEARKYTPRTPSDHFPVMVVLSLPQPDDEVSLKRVFDRITSTTDMSRGENEKMVLRDLKLSGKASIKGVKATGKSEAAIHGNAEPRPQILEAISVIPQKYIALNGDSDNHKIYRVYFVPSKDNPEVGEALFVVVGFGGNDSVVVYTPAIEKSKLAKTYNL